MLRNFLVSGKASVIVGGMYGSEGKGLAAAWVGAQMKFDILTTGAGAQSGHTSIHGGQKRVVFHLPSAQFGDSAHKPICYINAGGILDPDLLRKEIEEFGSYFSAFYIHPNAAIITQDCRDAEGRADSAQTKIASTRKGVGEALARKVLRSGIIVKSASNVIDNHRWMMPFMRRLDLNAEMQLGKSVLVEVPQGIGLSLNGPFYPHCTSRDCTPAQAASDAGIHPSFVGPVMLVLRTFPIRVGNIEFNHTVYNDTGDVVNNQLQILGQSGGCYPDQREISWEELGVPPEITTVTKRVRRVFTWSQLQVIEAMRIARPTHVFLSHVDYLGDFEQTHVALISYISNILTAAIKAGVPEPQIVYSTGPTTADVHFVERT